MTGNLVQLRTEDELQRVVLFYLERVMEQLEHGSVRLARQTCERYRTFFATLLKANHLQRIEASVSQEEAWTPEKEAKFYERMKNAWEFGEHKVVHDCAREILLHHHHDSDPCALCVKVNEILVMNNAKYIEPDSIAINTFIDAKIDFIVEKRKSNSQANKILQGNPGFYLEDAVGTRYRCFVKQVNNVKPGDVLKLKITNIPGLAIATRNNQEPILYLEPRVAPGELIEIELVSLSHTENSFTFRHHSYDGFLWFKRRGVNKAIFNKSTLRPGDRVIAKVLYTTEEEKRSGNGNITRLGIIKAIPVRKAGQEQNPEDNPNTGAAKALN
ncbi:MAG: hypothetical protein ACE15F_15065 [bacterium]